MLHYVYYESPCGRMVIGELGGEVCFCDWMTENGERLRKRIVKHLKCGLEQKATPLIREVVRQLDEYFAGRRRSFELPLLETGTPFQREVRRELRTISYGETLTYGEVARRLGRPSAVRAVARAIATNPLSLLVPCHRVIGSSGNLTGYAGSLSAKAILLSLERTVSASTEVTVKP